ncbi:unnamed protein product [Schistosoma mattheei]|uniref:Uncharacterized protein n=1 Tax=Schistosoma mattheei TaxID=31246 RepID=A0A183PKA9_9TREM|nr:unnamed protein product [Schistosoma mattheei]
MHDTQDSEVQSYVPLPIPSSTSVSVKCDYTLSSNVTNITELHKYNSNAHDQEFINVTRITWELVINSFDQPKPKRFTDPDVSKTKIDCQIAGQQQRRDKRQVDYDVYYPSKSVRLETNLSPDYFVQVGTILEIKCTAEPGNPPPKLSLLRQRFDESKATVIQTKTRHLSQSNSFINIHKDIAQEFMVTLSEEDNGASFFCEVISTGIKSSKVRSDSVRYNISCK